MGRIDYLIGWENKAPDWVDWKQLLESSERIQQLRGLAAFLAIHDWVPGNGDRAGLLDDSVRNRLSELANSPDKWVSEEAKLELGLL